MKFTLLPVAFVQLIEDPAAALTLGGAHIFALTILVSSCAGSCWYLGKVVMRVTIVQLSGERLELDVESSASVRELQRRA